MSVIIKGGISGQLADVNSSNQMLVAMSNAGAANGATNQVSVTNSATVIVTARATRRSLKITNLGTADVFIGFTSGVLTTTGDLLLGSKGSFVSIPTNAAVWGIVASTSVSVSVMEIYD